MTDQEDFTILLVGRFPWYYKNTEVSEMLSVEEEAKPLVTTPVDKMNGKSKGYCLVKYPTVFVAKKAKDKFTDLKVEGERLMIKFISPDHLKNLSYYKFGDTRINRNLNSLRFLNSLRPYYLVPVSEKANFQNTNHVYLDQENNNLMMFLLEESGMSKPTNNVNKGNKRFKK